MDEPEVAPIAERTIPTAAGIYDWLLGGHHYLPCDADAAITALKAFPTLGLVARVNRAFLQRTVRFLARQGIRQFLDIGSGYPVAGNVHEIAQVRAPDSRVVYVDHDEHTVAVSRDLLAENPGTICIEGDLREPARIFTNAEVRALLDIQRPIGLLLVSVLPFIEGDAAPLVVRYLEHLSPGSYLVISHITESQDERVRRQQNQMKNDYNTTVKQRARLRTREEITALFNGTELVPPGVVSLPDWRPLNPGKQMRDDTGVVQLGGIGQLPMTRNPQHGQ